MKPYRCFPLTPVAWIIGFCLATLTLLGALIAGPPTMTAAFHSSGDAAPAASNQPQGALTIPYDDIPVTLDGICDSSAEYSEAAAFLFNDTPISGTVFLKQDDANLYVCMEGSLGSYPQRFASVYLDTDNGQEDWAQADDYALRVDIITGTLSAWSGTGVPNGYASAIRHAPPERLGLRRVQNSHRPHRRRLQCAFRDCRVPSLGQPGQRR